jgi:hypothetical protein
MTVHLFPLCHRNRLDCVTRSLRTQLGGCIEIGGNRRRCGHYSFAVAL